MKRPFLDAKNYFEVCWSLCAMMHHVILNPLSRLFKTSAHTAANDFWHHLVWLVGLSFTVNSTLSSSLGDEEGFQLPFCYASKCHPFLLSCTKVLRQLPVFQEKSIPNSVGQQKQWSFRAFSSNSGSSMEPELRKILWLRAIDHLWNQECLNVDLALNPHLAQNDTGLSRCCWNAWQARWSRYLGATETFMSHAQHESVFSKRIKTHWKLISPEVEQGEQGFHIVMHSDDF